MRRHLVPRLPQDSDVLLKLAEFIADERLCRPFLSFDLRVEAEGGPVWLRLIGPEGVKEFLRMELSGFDIAGSFALIYTQRSVTRKIESCYARLGRL